MQLLAGLDKKARRKEAVENRLSFHGPNASLAVYDTYEPAQQVALSSDNLLYCAMLSGTKRMHGATTLPRLFLPQESFVMAPGQPVWIDFPDARPDTPTTCIAIDIGLDRIGSVAQRLNEQSSRDPELGQYQYQPQAVHCRHGLGTQQLLERLISTFVEPQPDQALLIDLQLTELVMRLLRQQSRSLLLDALHQGQIHHGLLAAMQYLKTQLGRPLDMARLSQEACLSKAQLYRLFRQELGLTPGEYLLAQRLEKARHYLVRQDISITEVAFELGFQSLSHFSRRFKAATGHSPTAFRRQGALAVSP